MDTNTTGFLESHDFCAAIRKLVDVLVIFFVCICTYICMGLGLFVGVSAMTHGTVGDTLPTHPLAPSESNNRRSFARG